MPASKYVLSKKDFESLNEILHDYRGVVLFTMGSAEKQLEYIRTTMKEESTDASYAQVLAEEAENIQRDTVALLDIAKRRDELHNKIKKALGMPEDEGIDIALETLKQKEAEFKTKQDANATDVEGTVTEGEVIQPDVTGTV